MALSMTNFYPCPLAPQSLNFAMQILLFAWYTVSVVTHACATAVQDFYTTWVRGVACQKTTFRTKIGGVLAREHPKNLGPLSLLILATVEASNCKFGTQLGFVTSLPKKQRLGPKWCGSGLGEHPKKFVTPYLFCHPSKLATSNFVHKFGLGSSVRRNNI